MKYLKENVMQMNHLQEAIFHQKSKDRIGIAIFLLYKLQEFMNFSILFNQFHDKM